MNLEEFDSVEMAYLQGSGDALDMIYSFVL